MRFNLVVQFSLKIFCEKFLGWVFASDGGCFVYDAFGALCIVYETLFRSMLVLAGMGDVVRKDQKAMLTNYAEFSWVLKMCLKSRGYRLESGR